MAVWVFSLKLRGLSKGFAIPTSLWRGFGRDPHFGLGQGTGWSKMDP